MIPILYKKNDTNYARNGAGFLVDIISCTVTEERNGAFECSFTYPVTGQHYSQIAEGDTIKAKPNETSDLQLFRIYSHSKPLNGVVTYNAEHISYDANGLPLAALISQNTTAAAAINKAIHDAAFENSFTAWSDISGFNNISLTEPCSLRAALGGQDGSVLDVWGGEYEFDNYAIKLHAHRGADNGVSIEYGKNLTDIKQETNITETYTHLFPYAVYDEEIAGSDETREVVVTLTEKVIAFPAAENIGHQKAYIVDLSEMFGENENITESTLRTKAAEFIAAHASLGVPKVNINVSFVALWQTEEYKAVAPLERVRLCDTVTVRFVKLGISAKAKVIKTVYDVVKERYASVELGEARSSFVDTILEQAEAVEELSRTVRKGFADATESMKKAIADATAAITGNSGGYVVLHPAEHPQEILIMDNPNIDDALRVWRWNSSGLGYSSTGYNGTYGTAITMNGAIVADYITAGTLNGALLQANSVQANAISAGFKQQIANAITQEHTAITQEFTIADSSLRSLIAENNQKYDLEEYSVTYCDYGNPDTLGYVAELGDMYLDMRNGDLYATVDDNGVISWDFFKRLTPITTEIYTEISQTATSITLSFNTKLQNDYYTKTQTEGKISEAAGALTLSFNTKLGNEYYTQTQTDAQIALSKAGIVSTVAESESKYNEGNYNISLYGFGLPADNGYAAGGHIGEYYLDQSSGDLYSAAMSASGPAWSKIITLPLITTGLQSQITQNAAAISTKVSSGDVVSEINQSADTISLTAGRLVITTGNFQIDGSGNVTLISGSLRGGSIVSSNYQTGAGGTVVQGMAIGLSTGAIIAVGYELQPDGTFTTDGQITASGEIKSNHRVVSPAVVADTYKCNEKIVMANEKYMQYEFSSGGTTSYRPIAGWKTGKGVMIGNPVSSLWLQGENIYANGSPVATSSDRRQKENITPLANKYADMLKAITPVSFNYDSEIAHSGRKHTGFIAQDVLQAMTAAGIDTSEFAAFVDVYGDGTEYALRYEEFISPLLAYVQQLEARITALENVLDNREGYNADDNANQT